MVNSASSWAHLVGGGLFRFVHVFNSNLDFNKISAIPPGINEFTHVNTYSILILSIFLSTTKFRTVDSKQCRDL